MRLGIDLGGTKIEIIALGDNGRELLRRRVLTPRGDYGATLQAVAGLVREAEAALQMTGSVGVGMPGSESILTGHIRNANSTCLIGQPLGRDLEALLQRPVRLANDANCFALSEAMDGAGQGARCVFGVILGTGVGGGLVIDGQVLRGANGIAGEWGHIPLPGAGADDLPLPPCYCGRHGCVETYLSGPALAADHLRHGGEAMEAAAIAGRRGRRRRPLRGHPAALRSPSGAGPGHGNEYRGPGRDRPRRRSVQPATALCQRAPPVGTPRLFRPHRHPPAAARARRLLRSAGRRLAVVIA